MQFNRLIFRDLAKSNLDVLVVHGFSDFVDRSNRLLKQTLFEQRSENDVLHINDSGVVVTVSWFVVLNLQYFHQGVSKVKGR